MEETYDEQRRRVARQDASAHVAKAEAHFQAGRFDEGMGELGRATTCCLQGEVWDYEAEIHERMAGYNKGKENAILDYEFAADARFNYGNALKEKGQIEEACANFKRALADCENAIALNPRSSGGFLTSKSAVQGVINALNCP